MEGTDRLLNIDYNIHNCSWLSYPHKRVIPPVVPKDKSAIDDVALPILNATMEESSEEFLPE